MAIRFAEEDRELDVVPPTANEARPLVVLPKQIFVSIDKDGTYYLEGQPLDTEALEVALRQVVANNPSNPSVKIRGDQRSECRSLVAVMNLCNKVGIVDYSVATSSKGGMSQKEE